jgi:2-polyprenyl-3-methyl-5-hydroxy-6-metoxy-1,4-benzoquinol methylase
VEKLFIKVKTSMSQTSNDHFSETEIRPEELMSKEAELFEADVRKLLTRRSEFVRVACPGCGREERVYLFEKMGQSYDHCTACETVFVNPRPTPELLEEYYTNSTYYTYWNSVIFPSSEAVRREKIFKPRAERLVSIVDHYGLQVKRFLEVGAGFGTFCEEVGKLGLFENIVAIEPTPGLAESCRNRGIEVIQKPIEFVDLKNHQVDVIACFEVIEHLFSPADFIQQCERLLASAGLLILTCPNIKGFDILMLQEISDSVDPEHLNYFHPESLSKLVERHGFKVLESQTPGRLDAELVRKKALSGEYDLSPHPFLKRVLLDDWDQIGIAFQDFIAGNGYSSHMWIVAQKY